MKLLTIATCLFSIAATFIVSAQQTVQSSNSTTTSAIISQYGSTFKNAGGNVLSDKVNVYIIFYGNWTSEQSIQEQNIFMKFIDNISYSPWFSLLKQYTDSNGKAVTGPLNLVAAVNDAGSHSTNLTDTLHKQIVIDAVNSGYLSPTNRIDSNGVYIIMGGPDVSDSNFCSKNCGYNSYSDEFQYMFIGYPGLCPDICIPSMNKDHSPNNSPAMDAAITIFSHEIQDVLTDPRGNAWEIQTSSGLTVELADFCSSAGTSTEEFGNVTQTQSGSYNLELNGNKYLVQTVFDLESKQCSLG
ncbi:MAG: phosphate-induced protein 1, partial [Benjaminiella poitrasii]